MYHRLLQLPVNGQRMILLVFGYIYLCNEFNHLNHKYILSRFKTIYRLTQSPSPRTQWHSIPKANTNRMSCFQTNVLALLSTHKRIPLARLNHSNWLKHRLDYIRIFSSFFLHKVQVVGWNTGDSQVFSLSMSTSCACSVDCVGCGVFGSPTIIHHTPKIDLVEAILHCWLQPMFMLSAHLEVSFLVPTLE